MLEGKVKILCVDDDPELLSITSEILRTEGYEVIEASTGNECLSLTKKEHPVLVLLDVNLPDINGIEVCKRIKADPDFVGTYVLLISGTATASNIQAKGLKAGSDGYIARPILGEEFLTRIQAILRIKKAETELREINERLRQKIIEFEEAKLLAEAANRARSDFLANMSHETTTPLNSIIGFSQILQDELYGELNEKQKEYVSDILSSGTQLLGLITDMLDLARATSGSMELKLSRFLVKDVLKSAMMVFNEEAMKHNLNLSIDIEPEADIEIEADSGKLNQIMSQLLTNAVKFTPDGGSVRVAARRVKSSESGVKSEENPPIFPFSKVELPEIPPLVKGGEGGFFIEISVSDTGIGIKSEDMPKLFHEVAQIESPYTKKYSGTGVGLMLAKKLVEFLRGRIWVESEYGRGSTFKFVIPCKGKEPSEQIIDPVTKLLSWEHFLKHISRALSFHKRTGRQFGLLRIEISTVFEPEGDMSVITVLKGLVRHHEILSKSRDGYYYLVTFEADKKVVEDTVLRITAALNEKGYNPVIKSAVYREDGENINELLEALNN